MSFLYILLRVTSLISGSFLDERRLIECSNTAFNHKLNLLKIWKEFHDFSIF